MCGVDFKWVDSADLKWVGDAGSRSSLCCQRLVQLFKSMVTVPQVLGKSSSMPPWPLCVCVCVCVCLTVIRFFNVTFKHYLKNVTLKI